MGGPEDGNRTKYVNVHHILVDIRIFFLYSGEPVIAGDFQDVGSHLRIAGSGGLSGSGSSLGLSKFDEEITGGGGWWWSIATESQRLPR